MGYQQRERTRRNWQAAAALAVKRRNVTKTGRRYWLTPKAARKRCSHCGAVGCVAVRPTDGKTACAECVDRLGIKAHESTPWREAGRRPYSPVTTRFVDPESLR